MKRNAFIFLSCCFLVIFLSNFKIKKTNSFVFSMLTEEPQLPETPYTYNDVVFPQHLLNPDTIETGYESGGVDPRAFDDIENDVATLGRVLFYDQKLSALENISCASCHNQSLSFTENKSFSEGISAPTKRNSMHLNDMAWTNNKSFFWDMSETDLHEMIRLPLTDENEIGANMDEIAMKLSLTDYYPELFVKAFGDPLITEDRIVDGLVQFIMSMNTFNSKFDQEAAQGFSGFTIQEELGLQLFSENCTFCHNQGKHAFFEEELGNFGTPLESFPFLFNNGLPADPDDAGAGEWNPGFENLFKIPSLRNIELTAPYMHDGRFDNLDDVINFYSEETEENEWSFGFIPPGGFQFSEVEKSSLKAFLKTLTDETFLTNPIWSDPFGETVNVPQNGFDNFVIKPNPLSDYSIIEFDNSLEKLTSISIYSSEGRLVKHDNFSSNTYRLNKSEFNTGMYLLEIIQGDKKQTQKLIVN